MISEVSDEIGERDMMRCQSVEPLTVLNAFEPRNIALITGNAGSRIFGKYG